MNSETGININISKNSDINDIIDNSFNEFKEYIIKNNIFLQNENKNFLEKLREVEKNFDEKEEEIDKFEVRIQYMKGLLQNLNELRNNYKKIVQKLEERQKIVQELHKKNIKNYTDIFKLLIFTNFITLLVPFYFINYYILILQTCYIILTTFTFSKIKQKYQNIFDIKCINKDTSKVFVDLSTEINKLNKEIIKIEESNISLDNWICEI